MPSLFTRSRTSSNSNVNINNNNNNNNNNNEKTTGHYHTTQGLLSPPDEFGRVPSRSSIKGITAALSNTTSNSGGKTKGKKEKKERERKEKVKSDEGEGVGEEAGNVHDGFLPTSLGAVVVGHGLQALEQQYGYLSYQKHVVLGIEDVTALVGAVADELGDRGLTTPFLFSNTALDISPAAIRRLINAFLDTLDVARDDSALLSTANANVNVGTPRPSTASQNTITAPRYNNFQSQSRNGTKKSKEEAIKTFKEECQFANPQDLGMVLRWGLARVVRVMNGQEVRGLIGWDVYLEWRSAEQAASYPPHHFLTLLQLIPPQTRSLLLTLFTLLTRLIAHSTSSGLTPVSLSSLFGPLMFGLGHLSMAFHYAYAAYLRSAHAMEHLVLCFIRLQEWGGEGNNNNNSSSNNSSNAGNSVGVGVGVGGPIPSRLKTWIKGYPEWSVVALGREEEMDKERRGVRCLRVSCVRRNVRAYSVDLVRGCAGWGRIWGGSSSNSATGAGAGVSVDDDGAGNDLRSSKVWKRIVPVVNGQVLTPRYSDAFRKRMDLNVGFIPEYGRVVNTNGNNNINNLGSGILNLSSVGGGAIGMSNASSTASSVSSRSTESGVDVGDVEKSRFRNLTDLKWGVFEESGFMESDLGKLQFDLNESAKNDRYQKRTTLTWADFSSSGFMRDDPLLSTTLQFSTPLKDLVADWPNQSAEIQRKLKKSQKGLPSFGWDTGPVVGGEEVVEEGFLDVFCDLVYGSGWMERGEVSFRECNWALVEFKSLPESYQHQKDNTTTATATSMISSSTNSDPRSETQTFLFEEFVPSEYRAQLMNSTGFNNISIPLPSSMRKHLPNLFSGGRKGGGAWKPAATLNGKPYQIGVVPRSPTAREVEFEGLLRGEGGLTKVITLEQAASGEGGRRVKVQTLTGGANAKVNSPTKSTKVPSVMVNTNVVGNSSANGGTQQLSSTTTPTNTSAASAAPLPSTSSNAPPPTPVKDSEPRKRFKFPGSPPGIGTNRHGMVLVPAEYDTLEFDTKLRGVSEEDLVGSGSGEGGGGASGGEVGFGKSGKRKKSEPWVDILVAGRERIGEQDAETKLVSDGGTGGVTIQNVVVDDNANVDADVDVAKRSDPELATREVEKALAEIKQFHSPPEEESVYDEDVESVVNVKTLPKRPTYFDLHPERRMRSTSEPLEFESDVDTSSGGGLRIDVGHLHDENIFHGFSEPSSTEPVPPRDSTYTYSENDFDPLSDTYTYDEERDVEVPAFVDDESMLSRSRSRTPDGLRSQLLQPQGTGQSQTSVSSDTNRGRTAALIELYREKERQSIASPIPSRLPVRSIMTSATSPVYEQPLSASNVSSPPAVVPAQQIQIQLPPPQTTLQVPDPEEVDVEEEVEEEILVPLQPPPLLGLDAISRASPLRYVHGAPLHNVIEDEEEE